MKTKTIFVVTQIFYTMLTLLPTPLFYGSYRLRYKFLFLILKPIKIAQLCLLCHSVLVDYLEGWILLHRGLL